jgi:hypothetical protein
MTGWRPPDYHWSRFGHPKVERRLDHDEDGGTNDDDATTE